MIRRMITVAVLFAACTFCYAVGASSAQETGKDGGDPASRSRREFLALAGLENITTGILYDLVLPLSGIERFGGAESPRAARTGDWKQLYHELYRAGLEVPSRPSLSLLMKRADAAAAEGRIPVAVIDLAYNRLEGDSAAEYRAFAAAALRPRTYNGRRITFTMGRRWYFTDENRGDRFFPDLVEIDFSDGGGFREILPDEPIAVGYRAAGAKICRVRCTMPGDEVLHAAFRFDVLALETPAPHDTIEVTADVPYEGQYASGEAYVYLADPLSPLSSPIVVLEGFDMDNTMFWDELYNDLNQQDLIENVRAEGFDVVVLNFLNSTDYMQRNSLVVVKLLSQIQSMIPQSRNIVLIGASMGGLCGRYALAWMEQNGPGHHVRTFISFDAPNRGANIPLGVQYWVKFFSIESAAAGEMLAGLESPAARQMLVYHFTDPPGTTGESDPMRAVFLGELAALGGYPALPRTAAIANGSGSMAGQGFSPGEQIILYEYGSFLVDIVGNVWAVPDMAGQTIFDGLIDRIWPFPDDQMAVSVSGTAPYDNAPGGSRPSMAQMDSTEAPYGDIIALHESHCFIPTVSALDIDTGDLFHDIAGDPSIMSLTPFDTIYYPAVNEGHIFISSQCAGWLLEEIRIGVTAAEGRTPAPGRIVLSQNWPNPFNPNTRIRFGIGGRSIVTLRIYDAAGRLMRTLFEGVLEAGWHEETWDGMDGSGRPAASGVYFCRLRAGSLEESHKMILLR